MASASPTPLEIRRPSNNADDSQEPSPTDSEGSVKSSTSWSRIEAPFTIRINGGVETISINLEDDADVKAQDFALAHNINIVHERRIAEQIRIRQLSMARAMVRKLDEEARNSLTFRGASSSPEATPRSGPLETTLGASTSLLSGPSYDSLSSPRPVNDITPMTITPRPLASTSATGFSLTSSEGSDSRPPPTGDSKKRDERIRELEEDLRDKEKELSKALTRSVRLKAQVDESHARLRVANNAEEQLKHASLQVDRLKERLEEIEAREAEWKRKAQESMREREKLEKSVSWKGREARDLRRALQRFALDGSLQAALDTAQRLSSHAVTGAQGPRPATGAGEEVVQQKEAVTAGSAAAAAQQQDQVTASRLKDALEDLLQRYESLKAAVAEPADEEEEGAGSSRRRRRRSAEPGGRGRAEGEEEADESVGDSRRVSFRSRSLSPGRGAATTSRLSFTTRAGFTAAGARSIGGSMTSPSRRQKENREPLTPDTNKTPQPRAWDTLSVSQRIHMEAAPVTSRQQANEGLQSGVVAVLQALFVHYSGTERMRGSLCLSLTRFHRLCKDAGLVSGGLKAGDVDVAFRKHTGSGAVHQQQQQGKAGTTARRPSDASSSSDKLLTFPNFLKALRHMATRLYSELIDQHVGRLVHSARSEYMLAAGDAALDLLIKDKVLPFAKKIGITGGAGRLTLVDLGPGLRSAEAQALLARELPRLRSEIYNVFSLPYHLPPPTRSPATAKAAAPSNNHGSRRASVKPVERVMGFEQLQALLLGYEVVPKLVPLAFAFDTFVQVLARDREKGQVTPVLADVKPSPPPADEHVASFHQFLEVLVRIAMESFGGIEELSDADRLSALFTWFRDEERNHRVVVHGKR